jgi:lipid-A-disaccharide synthase
MKKFFVITGEASGDLHASFLIQELRKRFPQSEFFGIGGKRMEEEGVHLYFSLENLAVIGFWEVVSKVRSIRRILRSMVKSLRRERPDVLILVDSPGFNLRLAPYAKLLGIKVVYYITPQVWAWGGWRLRSMYKNVDLALVIFPFEEKLLSDYGIEAYFVGHPILDEMKLRKSKDEFCSEHGLEEKKPIIALLPGSRTGEIKRLLPIMLRLAKKIKEKRDDVQFILPTLSEKMKDLLPLGEEVAVIFDETSDGINAADTVIAASGTVTLESAILRTPGVIVYKTSLATYLIVKLLIKLPYIGLVNIVKGRKIIPEFIQYAIETDTIVEEVVRMIEDTGYAESIKRELEEVRDLLGKKGAAVNGAEIIARVSG